MKKTFKLKAICRIAGLTVMLAAIAFSMAACGDDSGPGGSGGGSSIGNLSGSTWTSTFGEVLRFTDSSNYTFTFIGFECGGTYEVRGSKIYRTRTWGMELTNCDTTLTIEGSNTLRYPGGASFTRN
jgi:hypothetical protein